MIDRAASPADSYSPLRRTALVLTGTGTAGAYHAGALRAFQEAGVKIDIVAAHGVGVIGAMFSAIDGGGRLWDEGGYWRTANVDRLYPWRPALRGAVAAIALSFLVLTTPMLALAIGLIVFPIDFLLKIVGLGGAGGLTAWYTDLVNRVFAPEALPTWLPRAVLLILGTAAIAIAATAYGQWRARRPRGAPWWHVLPEPLSADPAVERCWTTLWDLVRGATQVKQPDRADLGRRFTEMLSENLGQPGFRELLMVVHDVDARRDLVFALVHERTRRAFLRGDPAASSELRAGEVFDLAGVARDHMADAVSAALSIPMATPYHALTFAPDSVWRGETHRAADRPGGLERIIDELALLGVEQIILVTAASSLSGAHALAPPRLEGRARLGEYLQSSEAAVVRDVVARARADGRRMFVVRPSHNPIGPFDFAGGFDDRSVRAKPLTELIHQGYEDAYFQFVEPVVGGSGERVGQA